MKRSNIFFFLILIFSSFSLVNAQYGKISGVVKNEGRTLSGITIFLENTDFKTITDDFGYFEIDSLPANQYSLKIIAPDFKDFSKKIEVINNEEISIEIDLKSNEKLGEIEDVVITGTMKAVKRADSPVAIEVYSPAFFKKNPTPNIFESLQNINGVRPQLNCNICNTGDIHINGLEGPYTMILIDGMPIVSSLGSVYGLSGIPNSLVERIEIVKGPASSLYGSEAVGGLINIITKNPLNAPRVSADVFSTTWGEYNTDLGFKFKVGKNADVLTGINYFNFQNRIDNNNDNFTDVTLQDRISIFQKWNFSRKENRLFSLAARYMYEDRWGGELQYNKSFRGGDEVYAESIYTNRTELLGSYQLPFTEKIMFGFSLINHDQDSRYGTTSYIANQKIGFGQLTLDKKIGKHDLLFGTALRYTYYDDNTIATTSSRNENEPEKTVLPGIFVQDEITLSEKHRLLLGLRYDHHNFHGNIFTPRIAYKWSPNSNNIFRLNAGTGFRVVNLFTEDHAALTGARDVQILNDLKPEQSYNANFNYIKKISLNSGSVINLDFSAFYTYFTNRIVPDYLTNPNLIIYDNINGNAVSKGLTLNSDIVLSNGLKFLLGGTLMENTITEDEISTQQLLTEKFMGTWAISYQFKPIHLSVDYTGNIYSPMKLPLLGDLDPRNPNSPWWSIQNIQFTYSGMKNFEFYGGVKNILNWTPNKNNAFLIARAHDPFDQNVQFDNSGQVIATAENPYALTFDPSYVYAPNQGIRGFLGVRFNLK